MSKRFVRDLAERVSSTYLQAFLGLLLASGFGVDGVLDLSIAVKAAVAAIPAALSVLKGLLARGVGDKESASLAAPPIVAP
jgi:hypothetical protein